VISRYVGVGASIALGLSALLWPFRWQHLLLPVCPLQEAILDAPVPFLCSLVLPRVATTLSSAPTNMDRGRSKSWTSEEIVICNAELGTVSVPTEVERWKPPAELLRQTPRLASLRQRLVGCSKNVGSQVAAPEFPRERGREHAAVEMCSALRAGMQEIAKKMLLVSRQVPGIIGTTVWRDDMEIQILEAQDLAEDFYQEFANTECCLMFLERALDSFD